MFVPTHCWHPLPCTAPTTLMKALITSCLAYWISLFAGHPYISFKKYIHCLQTVEPVIRGLFLLNPVCISISSYLSSHIVYASFPLSGTLFILLVLLSWSALSRFRCEPPPPTCVLLYPSLISTFFKRSSIGVYQGIIVLPSVDDLYMLSLSSSLVK